MEKIDFRNNSLPALNSTNLNKMQDNIEDAMKSEYVESTVDTYNSNYINAIDNKFNFSLEEHVVGKWINGKLIYAKTMPVQNWTVGGSIDISHGIANMEEFIDYKAKVNRADGKSQKIPNNYVSPNTGTNYSISLYDIDTSSFRLFVSSPYTGSYAITSIYVTLYYTKTTD